MSTSINNYIFQNIYDRREHKLNSIKQIDGIYTREKKDMDNNIEYNRIFNDHNKKTELHNTNVIPFDRIKNDSYEKIENGNDISLFRDNNSKKKNVDFGGTLNNFDKIKTEGNKTGGEENIINQINNLSYLLLKIFYNNVSIDFIISGYNLMKPLLYLYSISRGEVHDKLNIYFNIKSLPITNKILSDIADESNIYEDNYIKIDKGINMNSDSYRIIKNNSNNSEITIYNFISIKLELEGFIEYNNNYLCGKNIEVMINDETIEIPNGEIILGLTNNIKLNIESNNLERRKMEKIIIPKIMGKNNFKLLEVLRKIGLDLYDDIKINNNSSYIRIYELYQKMEIEIYSNTKIKREIKKNEINMYKFYYIKNRRNTILMCGII